MAGVLLGQAIAQDVVIGNAARNCLQRGTRDRTPHQSHQTLPALQRSSFRAMRDARPLSWVFTPGFRGVNTHDAELRPRGRTSRHFAHHDRDRRSPPLPTRKPVPRTKAACPRYATAQRTCPDRGTNGRFRGNACPQLRSTFPMPHAIARGRFPRKRGGIHLVLAVTGAGANQREYRPR